MNKELSKPIMSRSRLKSKYAKSKLVSDRNKYKQQRNLCTRLRDRAIKADFDQAFSNIKGNSKPFYDIMKPYLTNKGALCCSDIILSENGDIITTDMVTVKASSTQGFAFIFLPNQDYIESFLKENKNLL